MNRHPIRILLLIIALLAATLTIATLIMPEPHTSRPTPTHPATITTTPAPTHSTSTDECYDPATTPDPAENFPPCSATPQRPTFAPDADITILALCATDGSPCESWMKDQSQIKIPIHTYGTMGKSLNGGVIRMQASELNDDGFELWGMPGHFHGAVS
jgi:hypothetical protein